MTAGRAFKPSLREVLLWQDDKAIQRDRHGTRVVPRDDKRFEHTPWSHANHQAPEAKLRFLAGFRRRNTPD